MTEFKHPSPDSSPPRRRAPYRARVIAVALILLPGLWSATGAGGSPSGELFAQNAPADAVQSASQSPLERMVRIRVVVNLYRPLRPYAAPEIQEWIGSGIWLGDGRILTDLYLVRFASVIEYWEPGVDPAQARPTVATLAHRGFDCGLAVIAESSEGANPKLSADVAALFPDQSVAVGQELKVFGFGSDSGSPDAGRDSSKARGVLVREYEAAGAIAGSDIDRHALYRVAPTRGSKAPDRGFSGGPAVLEDRFVGIYINEERAGGSYVLAPEVVRSFLADVAAEGRYDGFPRTGLHFESIGTEAARRYLGLESAKLTSGVLVRRVDFQSAAWGKVSPGDVLLAANDKALDFAGRIVVTPKERVPFQRWLQSLPGAPLKLKLLRKGGPAEVTLDLESPALRSPGPGRSRLLDQPKYFLGGGLVFQELEYDLIHARPVDQAEHAPAPRAEPEILHRYFNYYTDRIGEQVDRDLILTARLPDPVNSDADRFLNGIVRSVNGRRIRNLKDFAAEWSYTREAYVVIEFLNYDQPLILDFEATQKAEERIRTRYRLQENGRVR
ncbi:MAG: hypothetical protein RIF32_01715 [Leptospirales bacterium]|jgi:S1-C subfamily serine protease